MDNSKKVELFRQFISDFLQGPNVDAMIGTLADDAGRLSDLSIAVTDQLTISTASGVYLDKRLADKGVTRPPELGMSDIAFRRMGIKITAQKQVSELIHTILETFYGEAAVRANLTNTLAEPYNLEDGMELTFSLEDGEERTLTFRESDFININQAQASEIADVFTRFVRVQNLKGFAQTVTNLETKEVFVRLFGGAKGPYSTVSVLGGEANTRLLFPNIRGTELGVNDTAWEITRTVGSTLRFRWVGNSKPALNLVFPDDRVMIYGAGFSQFGLDGTFIVTNVRPPLTGPSLDAGWFEITNDAFSGLKSTQAGTNPPPNNPPNIIYSYTVVQAIYQHLVFMRPIKALPNRQVRYALAWEPRADLLRIYMPATTGIVSRGLEGATHLHNLFEEGNLNGAFGSATDDDLKVEVISDRIVRYKQNGYDNYGSGGSLVWGANTIPIDYVRREQFVTTVYCKTNHGLPKPVIPPPVGPLFNPEPPEYLKDQYGRSVTNEILSITVDIMPVDDKTFTFPSPYMVDLTKKYTIRSEFVVSRQKIFAGSTLTTLEVDGSLPNEPGILLIDLNTDKEEGPLRYLGVQAQNAPNIVNIVTVSQNGNIMTITTDAPHGAIPGSLIQINGTTFFNGAFTVNNVPNPTTIVALNPTAQVANQVGVGTVSVIVGNVRSTVLLDPSNDFNFDHAIGADLTLMSDRNAYQPAQDGTDYPFYVTGVAEGRVFAQEVIEQITALGINIEIIIVYPDDTGLGNQGGSSGDTSPVSDKVTVWGV